MDDIFSIAYNKGEGEAHLSERMEQGLNSLDLEWNSVKVTSQSRRAPLIEGDRSVGDGNMWDIRGIEFLDVLVEPTYTARGVLKIETSVYRKPAAADLYMQASSYHSGQVKAGMVKGEAIRYLII